MSKKRTSGLANLNLNCAAAKSVPKNKLNSGLSFFKVISSCQQMPFPPESVAWLQGIIGRRVTLRDVHRNLWNIEVERGRDGYFFNKGWPKFYHDNSLKPYDIVVFIHKHDNLFDFKLFGHNTCEKKGLMRAEAEEVEDLIIIDDDDDDDDDEGDSEEEESDDYNENEEGDNKETKASSSSLRQKQHTVGDYYGHDIFKSGLATQPKNPYFVSRTRTSRKNELYIPNEVLLGLSLKIPSRLYLEDERGRKWQAKIKKWKDGRVWCTGGWKTMCGANNIGINDTCICEFVQRSDQVYMLVQVVRAAAAAAAAAASGTSTPHKGGDNYSARRRDHYTTK